MNLENNHYRRLGIKLANLFTDYPTLPYQTSHFLMPATSLALTPGLGSFLKSLKTHPVETSIENLISCVALNVSF
jgi:hypothetical protein